MRRVPQDRRGFLGIEKRGVLGGLRNGVIGKPRNRWGTGPGFGFEVVRSGIGTVARNGSIKLHLRASVNCFPWIGAEVRTDAGRKCAALDRMALLALALFPSATSRSSRLSPMASSMSFNS